MRGRIVARFAKGRNCAAGLTRARRARHVAGVTERQSLAAGEVHVWLCAAETQVDADADGLVLSFGLPKGAYATVILRELLKS